MKFIFIMFLIMSCNLQHNKQLSAYAILDSLDIKKIIIKSYQFSEKGTVILEMNSLNDVKDFKGWFKPSIGSVVDEVNIKKFKPSGVITISTTTEESVEIYFQLFNCYQLKYSDKLIYEKFSYQMGQTLLELIEDEALKAGKEFQQ